MHIRRGLFRAWVVLFALWILAATCWLAYRLSHEPLAYQYVAHLGGGTPWEQDWSRPWYETHRSPSALDSAPNFRRLEPRYLPSWMDSVRAGRIHEIPFPDSTRLLLRSEWNQDDVHFLSNAFWQSRWSRYIERSKIVAAIALFVPIALFLLGVAVLWVTAGFRKA